MYSASDVTRSHSGFAIDDDDDDSVVPTEVPSSTTDGTGTGPGTRRYRAASYRNGRAPVSNGNRNSADGDRSQLVVDLLDSSSDEEEETASSDAVVAPTRAQKRARRQTLNSMGSTIDDAIDVEDEDELERKAAALLQSNHQIHHQTQDKEVRVALVKKAGQSLSSGIPVDRSSSRFRTSPVSSTEVVGAMVTLGVGATNSNQNEGDDKDGGQTNDSLNDDGKAHSLMENGDSSPNDSESDSDDSIAHVVHRQHRRISMKSSGLPPSRGRVTASINSSVPSSPHQDVIVDSSMSGEEKIPRVAPSTVERVAIHCGVAHKERLNKGACSIDKALVNEKFSRLSPSADDKAARSGVAAAILPRPTERGNEDETKNADPQVFKSSERMGHAPSSDESDGNADGEDTSHICDELESIEGAAGVALKSDCTRRPRQVSELPSSDSPTSSSRTSDASISDVPPQGSTDSSVESPTRIRRILCAKQLEWSMDGGPSHVLASGRQRVSRCIDEDPDDVASIRPTYDDRDFDGWIDSDEGEMSIQNEGTGSDDIEPGVMAIVYQRKYLDATSLPVVDFAVHSAESDEIIYEFRVTIKDSLIQGAGKGAFLTFLGARVLPPFRQRGAMYLKETRPFTKSETTEALLAIHPNGFFVNVKVTGDSLHSPYNCERLLPTYLVAAVPEATRAMKEMKIKFANPEDPYFDKEIEAMQNTSDSVGFLGIHSLRDYVDAPDLNFKSNRGRWELIQLALYGPFQAADRKELNHYELKTFIFSNEPGEWGFEIDQKRPDGRVEVADITDDFTGMPHSVARENIAMYINETAGDLKLQQTVIAWDHKKTGRIHYYLDVSKAMKKEEEIELLVSYDDHYDEIRQRKGYGASIKSGLVKSDDHFPTLLLRNFAERHKMQEMFEDLNKPIRLYELSNTMTTYWDRLVDVANNLLSDLEAAGTRQIIVPYVQQIVALRRLEWLSSSFLAKTRTRLQLLPLYRVCFLTQCDADIQTMKWPWWSKLLNLIHVRNDKLLDARGVDLVVKLKNELAEEHCYALRHTLIHPFDETLWCPMANELVLSFCKEIVCHSWRGNSVLFEFIAKKALEASEAIFNLDLEKLSFNARAGERFGVAREQGKLGSKFVIARKGTDDETNVLVAIDSLVDSTSACSIEVDKHWYRSKQIFPLARMFRDKFAPEAPAEDLENLCRSMGLAIGDLYTRIPKYEFKNGKWHRGTRGRRKGPSAQQSASKSDRPKKKRTSSFLFWKVVWPELETSGWILGRGNRPNDVYMLPPGVERGRGFKNRVDFFDSTFLALKCIESDPRYCNIPKMKALVDKYRACLALYQKITLKQVKVPPECVRNKDLLVDWLKSEVTKTNELGDRSSRQAIE